MTTKNNLGVRYYTITYPMFTMTKTKEQIVAELLKKKYITTEEASILLQKEFIYIPQYPLRPSWPYNYPFITYANNPNATN